jgi:hypothetical protein
MEVRQCGSRFSAAVPDPAAPHLREVRQSSSAHPPHRSRQKNLRMSPHPVPAPTADCGTSIPPGHDLNFARRPARFSFPFRGRVQNAPSPVPVVGRLARTSRPPSRRARNCLDFARAEVFRPRRSDVRVLPGVWRPRPWSFRTRSQERENLRFSAALDRRRSRVRREGHWPLPRGWVGSGNPACSGPARETTHAFRRQKTFGQDDRRGGIGGRSPASLRTGGSKNPRVAEIENELLRR